MIKIGAFSRPSSILFGGLSRVACQTDLYVYSGRPCAQNGLMKLADSEQKLDFYIKEWSKSVPKFSLFKWSKFERLLSRDFEQNGSFFEFAAKVTGAILEPVWLEHHTKFQPNPRPPGHLKITSNGRCKCQYWAKVIKNWQLNTLAALSGSFSEELEYFQRAKNWYTSYQCSVNTP